MLNYQDPLDLAFQALADGNRRAMLARLAKGPVSVSALAGPLSISLPAAMQHVAVLEHAGLVRSEKAGRVRTCRIEPAGMTLAEHWLSQRREEWEHRFDRLDDYLKTLNPEGDGNGT